MGLRKDLYVFLLHNVYKNQMKPSEVTLLSEYTFNMAKQIMGIHKYLVQELTESHEN